MNGLRKALIESRNMFEKTDKVLVLSCVIFSSLLLPYINSIPYLDGNVEFRMTYDFYSGGFEKYFENFQGSLHPPLKLFVSSMFYRIFGFSAFSYNLVGFVFGIAGIIGIYFLAESIFDKKTARISSLLLSAFPIFIATGIFSLNDYLLSVLTVISLLFYVKGSFFGYAISSSCLVLTKEYGLILPCAIIVSEFVLFFFRKRGKNKTNHFGIIALLIPLTVFGLWYSFLKANGFGEWGDWNFSETKEKGSFYTVLNNVFTLNIFNKHALQQWSQLFILNFNWVYWLTLFSGIMLFVSDRQNRKKIKLSLSVGEAKTKAIASVLIFFIVHFFCVLSFQTFTIPRYALVLYPFLIIFTSFSINKLSEKIAGSKIFIYTLFFSLIFISLFFSLDPVSRHMWPVINATDGNEIYNLIGPGGGPDAITYNAQYLVLVDRRTESILSEGQDKYPGICGWMFEDVESMKMLGVDYNESMCK